MLDISAATKALQKEFPKATVVSHIDYQGLYIFRISTTDELDYDPFRSVDKQTGEVKEFSILTDGDITEITKLFMQQSSS